MSEQDIEIAAALAAVEAYLRAEAQEQAMDEAAPAIERAGWREGARLAACGVPAPLRSRGGWSTAECLRHGAGGFYGVIGL
jgi:hypothetical protein